MAERAGGRLEALPLDARGPGCETLGIDIVWFGDAKARRVVLHSSGLHGVEGFAGSAIQIQTVRELPRISEGTALILVHILNPYGISWLRRANENNVDLNRNSLIDDAYTGAPENYSKLDPFLNPPSPPSQDLFLLRLHCWCCATACQLFDRPSQGDNTSSQKVCSLAAKDSSRDFKTTWYILNGDWLRWNASWRSMSIRV